MSKCCDNPIQLCQFPTELLICIFKNLSAKNLVICRQVCCRWKVVIDHIANDDVLWEKYCQQDYKTVYKEAKKKSDSCRLWFDIYRSLSLWRCLPDASELQDEFCHSSSYPDSIRDLRALKNGIFYVHKHTAVVYYDVVTLNVTKRNPLYGDFLKFVELEDDTLIILGNHLHLRIVRNLKQKLQDSVLSGESEIQDDEVIFSNTKYFLTVNRDVYFVNISNDIYHCNVDGHLTATLLSRYYSENIMALSFYNGYLNVLTVERNVYAYQNNAFVKLFNLESKKSNIVDCLWQYQFIENINWRIFYMWVICLNIKIPEGPLRHIYTIRTYGDVFFIGCNNGILLIYYKPYVDGHLDFFNHKPVKEYSFAERNFMPVLSLQPILAVDVIETKGGHKILIAMPKKVIIITYIHKFEAVLSKAIVLYTLPGPVALKV